MAGDFNDIVRSPHSAAYIFGLGGESAPRPKNLFYVNFRRANDPAPTSGSSWLKDIKFLVKSVDRPSIQPTTEELNQYGKKRQVHTGVKYAPIRMTIYDTADSMAMRMFSEYTRHYFGDFRHEGAEADFKYDVTLGEFKDSAKQGFGFNPTSSSLSEMENDIQFFFDSIQVFQVYGDRYTQFNLINPRITAFDPDDLDYSNSEIATISLTIAYEAIIYVNNGAPAAFGSDQNEVFQDIRFQGSIVDYADDNAVTQTRTGNIQPPTGEYDPRVWGYQNQLADQMVVREYTSSIATGSLNSYGSFSFGSIATTQSIPLSNVVSDVALLSASNPAVAAALQIADALPTPSSDVVTSQLPTMKANRPIDGAQYDVARNAVSALGSRSGRLDQSYIGEDVVGGVLATGDGSPRDALYNDAPPASDTPETNSWNSASNKGVALTSDAYGFINARRPPHSQIGFNHRKK